MKVWKEVNPKQETTETLSGDEDEVYKDTNEYKDFSLSGCVGQEHSMVMAASEGVNMDVVM